MKAELRMLRELIGKRRNEGPLIISCIFGTNFRGLYDAVDGIECVLFSNNPDIKHVTELRGWKYRLVKSQPLSNDYRISSIQSKYIKFLQFFNEFPEFAKRSNIIYFDHKFNFERPHIEKVEAEFSADKSIYIRNTPRLKTSIQDEIHDAMGQPRYATVMPETIEWLNATLKNKNLSMNNRIMNTGFIYYKSIWRVSGLLENVYQTVWRLGQPECQIIWACLSQEYENLIQRTEWNNLNPHWQAPE